jgi:murein DD-endopeptidase MepM/ murein hydrolase activator NlpD
MTNQVLNQASKSRAISGLQCLGIVGLLTAGASAIAPLPVLAEEIGDIPSATDLLQLPPAADPAPEVAPPVPEIRVESTAVPEGLGVSAQEMLTAPVDASTYIDPSDAYDLGATPPDRIVLDERSTGCQTVIERGEERNFYSCAAIAPTAEGVPSRAVAAQLGDVPSVSLGPVSLNSRGMEWNPNFSVQNFLNITPRPIGRLGNGNGNLLFPLTIPAPISSLFGWRIHPIFGDARLHTGTDISAPMGTPIIAAWGGKVVTADFLQGYGLTVIMEHEGGTQQTLYAHMSEIFVQVGDEIQQGEVIGRVGSTGNSTGPHLHFEVRELTSGGWIALNANEALKTALENFSTDFQVAALAKSNEKTEAFTSLVQFGRFASKASLKDAAKPLPTLEAASDAEDGIVVIQVNELSD